MKKWINTPALDLSYFSTKFKKRSFLFLCLFSVVNYVQSQSIDMGLRGSISSAWLLNGNVMSGKDHQGYRLSISDNYGMHGTINFAHGYGLELDILKGKMSQSYGGVFDNDGAFPGSGVSYYPGEYYSANTDIEYIKIPVLFRYEHELSGAYGEGGLAYQIISSGTFSATYSGGLTPSGTIDITKQLPSGDFIAILGFGWDKHFTRESNFYLNLGFRFEYGLFDLMGVDGHGQNLTGSKSVVLYPPWTKPYYNAYHSTHSLEASFNIGVFYRLYPKSMLHKRVIDF